ESEGERPTDPPRSRPGGQGRSGRDAKEHGRRPVPVRADGGAGQPRVCVRPARAEQAGRGQVMKGDELRAARDRRPFRKCTIRISDGDEITVEHPENLAWDEKSGTAVCRSGGGWDVIDLGQITSLGLTAPPRPKASGA